MHEILENRNIISIEGPDTLPFLQNLVTNDVNKDYCYTYMLNSGGRYLFDFFIQKASEEKIYIDIAATQKDEFLKKLIFYKFRSKITIIDMSADYKILYSKTKPILPVIFSFSDPRYYLLSYRSMIDIKAANEINSITGLYNDDKYNYTIIDGSIDLEVASSIPIEYAAEQLGAISYNKGCYPGQEIVSRAKYQGEVRKKIVKIIFNEEILGLSREPIMQESNIIGKCLSTYKNLGIGLVKREEYIGGELKINGILVKLEKPQWSN